MKRLIAATTIQKGDDVEHMLCARSFPNTASTSGSIWTALLSSSASATPYAQRWITNCIVAELQRLREILFIGNAEGAAPNRGLELLYFSITFG
jgi:hypothetical protein